MNIKQEALEALGEYLTIERKHVEGTLFEDIMVRIHPGPHLPPSQYNQYRQVTSVVRVEASRLHDDSFPLLIRKLVYSVLDQLLKKADVV